MSTGLQERENGKLNPWCRVVSELQLTVPPHSAAGISFMLLVSRQGKVRLAKWFTTMSSKAKSQSAPSVLAVVGG